MTKAIELLKKAREKSGIASGFLHKEDLNDELHKKALLNRTIIEKVLKGARKDFDIADRISHASSKDFSNQDILAKIERDQKTVKSALKYGKINRGR